MAGTTLTDSRIRNLRPSDRRYEVRDIPGLVLRVEPTGRKTWVSIFKRQGTRTVRKLGDATALPIKDARSKHEENRHAFETGTGLTPPTLLSVARLFELYWEKAPHRGTRTLPERQRLVERDITSLIGDHDASNVSTGDLLILLEGIAERGAPVTANRVREVLRTAWKWAATRGMVPVDITANLPKMTDEKPRENIASVEQLAALWPRLHGEAPERFQKALSTEVSGALLLILFTACRSAEANFAQWREFDLPAGLWTIPPERFKSDRAHRIFLHPYIVEWLEEHKPPGGRGDDLVFVSSRTGRALGKKVLLQALQRSNKNEYTVHDLRRSVATAMGDLGTLPHVIERVLGHAKGGLVAVYNRSTLDGPAKDAWVQWGDQLTAPVADQMEVNENA